VDAVDLGAQECRARHQMVTAPHAHRHTPGCTHALYPCTPTHPRASTHHDQEKDVVDKVHLNEADDVGVLERAEHVHLLLHLLNLADAAELGPVHALDGHHLICGQG